MIPTDLIESCPAADAVISSPDMVDTLAASPGHYLLVLQINGDVALEKPRADTLTAGWYLYAGSALGPGGLRGRVGRHFRADKRPHWHIDQLTSGGNLIAALGYLHFSECQLVELLAGRGFAFPLPGFGSSDCRSCQSHLLRWPGKEEARA